MPPIHYLNPPPNPFWDFVAAFEDHPIFAAYGRPPNDTPGQHANPEPETTAAPQTEQAAEMSEKAKGKQASVEDPPEVDPSTVNKEKTSEKREGCGRDMPFRGRGRFGNAFEDGSDGPRRGHGCRGRGDFEGRGNHFGHRRPGGPPLYEFNNEAPWWARRGPPPPPGFGPHHGGRGGHRGPPHHHHGPHSPPGGRPGSDGFNLGEFLNRLGQRLGVDLSGAAEGLGLDRFSGPRNADADFEPRADVFDAPTSYTIHLSLPGAKKEDLGVDWDGENSVLRIAGVVHRPGVDEEMLTQLAVDGRKRETGVFEKSIRLGTKRDPASIDITGISAKMADGILVVKIPKVEVEHKKRDVPISGSGTPSPARATDSVHNEKASLLDGDNEMYDAAAAAPVNATAQEKEAEQQREIEVPQEHDARSETMDYEQPEKLPEYEAHEEDDWEHAGSEEEGEYVKINVN